jgi:hypothetical protein
MNDTEARAEMELVWHTEGVWAAFVGPMLSFVRHPREPDES